MNTAVIITKTEPEVKKKAQKLAKDIGISLSSLINAYLKQIIKTKTVSFSASDEEPSEYLKSVIRQAEENYKRGRTSPAFKTGEEAAKWLEKQGI